jgi:nicotinate-nucleotide--dimethylbenzimidazole phosphoribosyltransferase
MAIKLPPIEVPCKKIKKQIQDKLDNKSKPVGSLGYLEDLAMKIALIQQDLSPKLTNPTMLTMAADHHIVDEGVSCAPSIITWQQVENFSRGGGAIGLFCKIHEIDLWLVDAGVNHTFTPNPRIIDAKVRMGTRNFRHEAAMTQDECETAFNRGREIVNRFHKEDCNVIGFGEMGIGNSTPASALLSIYTGTPIDDCVGPGGGLKPKGIRIKAQLIEDAINLHGIPDDPFEILRLYGGLEIAMITGGMYQAALNKMIILVDGYITSSAALAAFKIDNNISEYFIFSHISGEGAHKYMLNYMGVRPLLNLDLRLGEGTGACLAYPIVKTSVSLLSDMTSFEEANVFNSSELTRL